ncbi:Os08g0226050 [Oryza sativa Japonica Group]|nr:Os08g0226050 [Oryza sativa Japonica Group]
MAAAATLFLLPADYRAPLATFDVRRPTLDPLPTASHRAPPPPPLPCSSRRPTVALSSPPSSSVAQHWIYYHPGATMQPPPLLPPSMHGEPATTHPLASAAALPSAIHRCAPENWKGESSWERV